MEHSDLEIISIQIYCKNDSLIDLYPFSLGEPDHGLSIFERFLSWAISNADSKGVVELEQSSYDTIIELTNWDDISCPQSFVIEYSRNSILYRLCIPYDKSTRSARIYE